MTEQTLTGPAWIPAFLAALAQTRKVGQAIKAAGIQPHSAYFQRRTNQRFAEAWRSVLAGPATAAVPPVRIEALPARNAGWRNGFFEALAETSNVSASADRVNVPLSTIYKLRRSDAAFANRWREALLEGYDHLEIELLGYLRDPQPGRKMDAPSALRLLAAHRETVERERALRAEDEAMASVESLAAFFEQMRRRRAANTAILTAAEAGDASE